MNKFLIIAIILPIIIAFDQIEEDRGILVLNKNNFDIAIRQYDYVMVEFYATWCSHCKNFEPLYVKIAETLKEKNNIARLAKVDAIKEVELADRFKIDGFPSLYFFIKGMQVEYHGRRSPDIVIDWIEKKMQPTCLESQEKEEIELAKTKNKFVAIFWLSQDNDVLLDLCNDVSKAQDDVVFFYSRDKELRSSYNADEGSLTFFKKFEEGRVDYKGDLTLQAINKFIMDNEFPTVVRVDNDFLRRVFTMREPVLLLFVGKNMESEWALDALYDAKPLLKGKIRMGYSKPGSELDQKLMEFCSVEGKTLPTLRLIEPLRDESARKYAINRINYTPENLYKVYEDWQTGKLKEIPPLSSIPDLDYDLIKILRGDNYENVVFDEEKDIVVGHTAISCDECNKMEDTLSNIAESTKDIEDLIISYVDIMANNIQGVNKSRLPAILFYPRHDKSNPIEYNGDFSEKDIMSFIKKNLK